MKQLLIIRCNTTDLQIALKSKKELSDEYRVLIIESDWGQELSFEYPKNYCQFNPEVLRVQMREV